MRVRPGLRFLVLGICAWALLLAGCNTVEGLGKDIKTGGEKLEDAANAHK